MMSKTEDGQNYWFAKVDIEVVRDKTLSPTAKFIFTVLCTFADKDKRGCWPSNEKVVDAAGVSIPTLKRAYKELEARGVISREARFSSGQQTSSYTLIVGHNAPCYGGFTSEPVGGSSMSHRTRINERDIKDSLTGEASLPEMPLVFEDGQPVDPPEPDNPKEVYSPSDAPAIMKPTAELFLYKTGRKGLTWKEVSALKELSATQRPARVQTEIDTAITRFTRRGQALSELTLSYITASLRNQPTWNPRNRHRAKPAHKDEHPELAPSTETFTDEQIAAMEAEILAEARRCGRVS